MAYVALFVIRDSALLYRFIVHYKSRQTETAKIALVFMKYIKEKKLWYIDKYFI